MSRPATVPAPVDYPCSDGTRLAESDFQLKPLVYALTALQTHFLDRAQVHVAGDMFVYFREGDPGAVVAPDVFVVFGAPKHMRSSYKLWEEPKAPDFVLEVTSRSTRAEDRGRKREVYAGLGVAEYWLFDPTGDWLAPRLQDSEAPRRSPPFSAPAPGGRNPAPPRPARSRTVPSMRRPRTVPPALREDPPPEVGRVRARQRRRHQRIARKCAEKLPVLHDIRSRFDAPGPERRGRELHAALCVALRGWSCLPRSAPRPRCSGSLVRPSPLPGRLSRNALARCVTSAPARRGRRFPAATPPRICHQVTAVGADLLELPLASQARPSPRPPPAFAGAEGATW